MRIEVLNTIKRKGDKRWEYNGKFYFNSKWIPVIGSVADYKTEAQIKRAIIKSIKAKAEKYKNSLKIPQKRKLGIDTVFKEII